MVPGSAVHKNKRRLPLPFWGAVTRAYITLPFQRFVMTGAMPISQSPFSGSFRMISSSEICSPRLLGRPFFPALAGNAYRIFRSKYHQWKEKWLFFQRTWNGPDSFRDSNIIPDKLKICKLVYIIMAGIFFRTVLFVDGMVGMTRLHTKGVDWCQCRFISLTGQKLQVDP